MNTSISIPPESALGKIGDILMLPLMHALSGTLSETPQRTHRWNVYHVSKEVSRHLPESLLTTVPRSNQAKKAYFLGFPLLHAPLFGGWREYAVFQPTDTVTNPWFVGWIASNGAGVSRIPLRGSVRLLCGPYQAKFFGIDSITGSVIPLSHRGEGRIGDSGEFSKLPLL